MYIIATKYLIKKISIMVDMYLVIVSQVTNCAQICPGLVTVELFSNY